MTLRPLLALALAASTLAAQDASLQPGHLGWTLAGSAAFGGDDVVTVLFTDGTSQSITAGQGLGFNVGGHYRLASAPIDLSATLGLKYATTKATNANINLNRTVIELRADYLLNDRFWIGAGPVWHSSIKLNTAGLTPNVDFATATGLGLKFGWKFLALGYTNMKYKDEFGTTYDASHIGFSVIGKW